MKTLIALLLATTSMAALAEHHDHDRRTPMPAVYVNECGSCHVAFPSRLLSADDWKRVMAELNKHYGDNASLDAASRAQIETFLTANAGSERRVAGAGNPPRITATSWFKREHDEVPAATWRDARVKSAANCSACHKGAAEGNFSEHEVSVPGSTRSWRD